MSDQPTGDPSQNPLNIPLDIDQIKEKGRQVYSDTPPEVKQAVQKSQSFYQEHKKIIHGVVIGVVALKFYKRRVAKASAKAVVKAFDKEMPTIIETVTAELGPNMLDIWESLKANPKMAYIPHGGGMVHMLGAKDAVITVFGDFSKMRTNDEIWDYVSRTLGFGALTRASISL